MSKRLVKNAKKALQEIVEEPELYMICMCCSSLSDQLAIMANRIECLTGLNEPVLSSNDICVKDSLHFLLGTTQPSHSKQAHNQVAITNAVVVVVKVIEWTTLPTHFVEV